MKTFYDLFSGIGGFRLGLERNGFQCVGSCEIDRYARQVYEKRFGDSPDQDRDARELVPRFMPDFDILCAGFPCQAFSYAGKELGFIDTRGTLFFEIARIAEQKRPEMLFLENVRGLLSHDKGKTFRRILDTLYEVGYDVEWQTIDGKYFLPQSRERVFIIGHLRGKPFKPVFPIIESSEYGEGTPAQTQSEGERVRDTHTRTIDSCYYKGWGGNRTVIFMAHTKGNIKQRVQNRDTIWCLDTGKHKIGLVENEGIRKLTPLECERLQGFPDNWTAVDGISDTQRYKMIGNAVMVPVIEYIARVLQ